MIQSDAEIAKRRTGLASIIQRFAPEYGVFETAVPPLPSSEVMFLQMRFTQFINQVYVLLFKVVKKFDCVMKATSMIR
ncbi:hypothetical protein D3C76_781070 [compost metagenome]